MNSPIGVREDEISEGGGALSRLVVAAEGHAIGGLVMVHGLGDHVGRYDEVFGEFARRGITTVAGDFPGHGQSGGPRGHIENREEIYSVIDGSLGRLRQLVPDRPLGIGAHSMGALLVMDYFASGRGADFDFVWLSSALVEPGHGQPAWKHFFGRLLAKLWPRLLISNGVRPADCYEMEAAGIEPGQGGSAGAHDSVSLGLAVELLKARDRVANNAGQLFGNSALLMTHGTADKVCPIAYAVGLFEQCSSTDKTFVEVPGALHEPWHDPQLVSQVADWMLERT
jgi:alpha-beta hydrolase superfamily lysophospholipase